MDENFNLDGLFSKGVSINSETLRSQTSAKTLERQNLILD